MSEDSLLLWCGLDDNENRDKLVKELFPANLGLKTLLSETKKTFSSTLTGFDGRKNEDQIKVPYSVRLHLVQLMYWVQDQHRIGLPLDFYEDDQDLFLMEIAQAEDRAELREQLKSKSESAVNAKFQHKLKGRGQWLPWLIELDSKLDSAYGVNGVKLSYVIREKDEPANHEVLDAGIDWNEKAVLMAKHDGAKYKEDCKSVHEIVMNNVAEGSEAYGHLKPILRKNDGRADIKALKRIYGGGAMRAIRIKVAENSFESVSYGDRGRTFEQFSSTLRHAVEELKENDRPMDNEKIVEEIFKKVKHPKLIPLISTMKVAQVRDGVPPYTEVLTDLAKHVASEIGNEALRRNTSQVNWDDSTIKITNEGSCPKDGPFLPDGRLYAGSYPPNQWFSEQVRPYHDKINAWRAENGKAGGRARGKGQQKKKKQQAHVKKLRKQERQIAELKKEHDTLKRTIASLQSGGDDAAAAGQDADQEDRSDQAGGSFGGRQAAIKNKKKKEG